MVRRCTSRMVGPMRTAALGRRSAATAATRPSFRSLDAMLTGLPMAYDARRLQRSPRQDGVAGIFARTPIEAGSLLGLVPVPLCVAPALVGWGPFGPALDAIFAKGVQAAAKRVPRQEDASAGAAVGSVPWLPRVLLPKFHKDVCMVTSMCALHLLSASTLSPVGLYISRIVEEAGCRGLGPSLAMEDFATDAAWSRYRQVCDCRDDLVAAMHDALVAGCGKLSSEHVLHRLVCESLGSHDVPLAHRAARDDLRRCLRNAHRMCESRCVTVPNGEDCFGGDGGPSLVPFVDLINHDFSDPNVAIATITDGSELRDMLDLATRRGLEGTERLAQPNASTRDGAENRETRPVPCVVVVASAPIATGEELHYQYVELEDPLAADDVFWAQRFQFLPGRPVKHSC